jgi:hypothetical protein
MKLPSTLFANRVEQQMRDKGFEVINVADMTEATYEHVRRIVRGDSFPSPYFLRVLCEKLDLDMVEMKKLIAVDKIRAKYGDELVDIAPELVRGTRRAS